MDQYHFFNILLSGAPAYWFTINASCDHTSQLSKRLGIDEDNYKKLLIATNLARYRGNVFCIAGDEWKSFLMGHHLFVHPLIVSSSHRLIVLSSCSLVVSSSRHLAVSSSRRPLTAPPSRRLIAQAGCCIASHCCCRHHSCHHRHCPFRRPPTSPNLVTVTITLFIAIAIACLPPLSPSPLLLLPSPLPLRHPPPSSPSPSPLPPSPLPPLSPASLVTVATKHVIAVTIAIALVAVNHLPPSLPLLLPPKSLLSSSHSTLVANAIARFIPLALFVTRHPYPHRHHLAALTLFGTCSHC